MLATQQRGMALQSSSPCAAACRRGAENRAADLFGDLRLVAHIVLQPVHKLTQPRLLLQRASERRFHVSQLIGERSHLRSRACSTRSAPEKRLRSGPARQSQQSDQTYTSRALPKHQSGGQKRAPLPAAPRAPRPRLRREHGPAPACPFLRPAAGARITALSATLLLQPRRRAAVSSKCRAASRGVPCRACVRRCLSRGWGRQRLAFPVLPAPASSPPAAETRPPAGWCRFAVARSLAPPAKRTARFSWDELTGRFSTRREPWVRPQRCGCVQGAGPQPAASSGAEAGQLSARSSPARSPWWL